MISRERNLIVSPDHGAIAMGEPEPASPGFTLRDVLYILFRHKWKMLFCFIFVATAGAYVVVHQPDFYSSSAKILIKTGQAPLTGVPNAMPEEAAYNAGQAVSAVRSIMLSEKLAQQVVDKLGPDLVLRRPQAPPSPVDALKRIGLGKIIERIWPEPPPPSPEAMRRYAKGVVMSSIGLRSEGNTIQVNYEAYDPAVAKVVLDTLLELYLVLHVEVHMPPLSTEFFKARVEEAKNDLAEAESALEDFRSKYDISSFASQRDNLIATTAEMEGTLRQAQADVQSSEARVAIFEQQLKDLAPKPSSETSNGKEESAQDLLLTSRLTQQLEDELRELRKEAGRRKRLYPAEARERKDIEDEIRINEEDLNKERERLSAQAEMGANVQGATGALPTFTDPARQQVVMQLGTEQATLSGFRARLQNLEKQLPEMKTRLKDLTEKESLYETLATQKSIANESYTRAQRDLRLSVDRGELDRRQASYVSIIDSATLPVRPTGPNKQRNLAMAFFAAFFGSLGLAVVIDYLNHTLKTNEDVEKHLGLPVLMTVSRKDYRSCI